MLITNFEYKYKGIKATVIGDDAYCDYMPFGTKITTLFKLFDLELINKGEIYWMHDFDCYQLIPFEKNEIVLTDVDMALCDYGRKKNKWRVQFLGIVGGHAGDGSLSLLDDLRQSADLGCYDWRAAGGCFHRYHAKGLVAAGYDDDVRGAEESAHHLG